MGNNVSATFAMRIVVEMMMYLNRYWVVSRATSLNNNKSVFR